MLTTITARPQPVSFSNQIHHGDCIEIMHQMPANSADFILTDPPYLVNYRDREGRTIQNDISEEWLKPAMAEAYRVLKQDRVAVMFYGWTKIDRFFAAWLGAGFQPVGHIVLRKNYASKSRFLRYQHEQAFFLAKGKPPLPKHPLGDVMDMPYSGNKLHSTQKPIPALVSLIRSFSLKGETVLDPFAGSGNITHQIIGIVRESLQAFSCDVCRASVLIRLRTHREAVIPGYGDRLFPSYVQGKIELHRFSAHNIDVCRLGLHETGGGGTHCILSRNETAH